jgi:hypothetical protein
LVWAPQVRFTDELDPELAAPQSFLYLVLDVAGHDVGDADRGVRKG